MKCYRWPIILLFAIFATLAQAETFDITHMTFTLGPFNASLPGEIGFTLAGPGTEISGIGNFVCSEAWCSFPATGVPPGNLTMTIGQIGLDSAFQSTVGGTTLLEHSWTLIDLSLNVLAAVNLPANPNGSTFTACVPASVPNLNFGEGQTAGGTFIQFNLNTPTKGTLCTTWNFSNGEYFFEEARFDSPTVPEPGTLALVAPGFAAIFPLLRRSALRKRALSAKYPNVRCNVSQVF